MYAKQRDAAVIRTTGIENGIQFTLNSAIAPGFITVPLTVVIEVSGVKIAQATREGDESSLPVSIKPDRLLVTVVPGSAPVTVRWRNN